MHICVLGAGVIGVTTAYRLLQDGHQVTLVDGRAHPGDGTSLGNGAQLSYSYVAPLADPSVWSKWAYYMFSSDSPLTFKPTLDPAQYRWLFEFLRCCNAERVRRTTIELLQLAFFSRDQLKQWNAQLDLQFDYQTSGKLVMYTDHAGLDSARKQVRFQSEFGCHQEVLDAARCIAIEPALGNSARDWAGGVYTPSEESGDCPQFCRALVASMQADANFRFIGNANVANVRTDGGALRAVQAGDEWIEADSFVLCFGPESPAFARRVGLSLPLYPLKGYSITVPLQDAASRDAAPQVSITDISRKIVYARLGDRLRVAGRVELVGMERSIPQRAIDELKQGVRELFPACALGEDAALSPWTGFRPATPSGVPVVGPSPVKNLYLNIGQGALGWTLACGSAALLADQIAGRKPAIDPAPFRFAG
ncbi:MULTISPECIES: D-amino acid dehydrogenase [unclassified Herbaspirillum]|uniref:D-amino acid dehydrogenase n=1 Tax=unclassified Herbaspirillum TaxID=2624150 RepID=UPI00114E3645|nr:MULTISPECIES: D-amino acid dehydrogenase [unclassified Herbaspirillum]MBB5392697.1 D-amino-acid dehydrogenase [Herbaspirillum sp. SJZ102]TQK06333.1 D-amino acid dehydrogenase small subunit [Herbaspirillum sp. SJZ130]TQK12189.1 D-amino acid dehydrogenase small subunit [Herbaspirillum sp. SJZ106]